MESKKQQKEYSWQCPVCGDPRYQKYGGLTIPAKNVHKDEKGSESSEETYFHAGVHFMCKGCSVFFSNPKKFNKKSIAEKEIH